MASMSCFLSIVIPAYNEVNRIRRSLDAVLRFLQSQNYRAEVIVVDDGSSDETAARVSDYISKFHDAGHDLRVLINKPNRGKGYSVKRGLTEATGEIVLFSDADFSSPITEAPKLIDPIAQGHVDVNVGSRALNRALIGVHQPRMRELGGMVFNLCMRAITGLKFKDTQCGFKAFRREPALPVFKLQRIDRFGFDAEVLYIAKKHGNRIVEVPVTWDHCEGGELQSKWNYLRDSIDMFVDLIRIRLNDLAGRYDAPKTHIASEAQQPVSRAATKQR